jgi:two-component system phosphate regulon response regulator OmpR
MDNFIAHILVVDDDDGIRSLVKKYLNENNYLVTTANSAEDAKEKIKIIKFDLINFRYNDARKKWIRIYSRK